MTISCSLPVFQALEGLTFPADKRQILDHASAGDAPQAVIASLSQLQEGVQYLGMNEVCENTSIRCSMETYHILQGLGYPTRKEAVLAYAESRGAGPVVMEALEQLSDEQRYRNIAEICWNLPTDWA